MTSAYRSQETIVQIAVAQFVVILGVVGCSLRVPPEPYAIHRRQTQKQIPVAQLAVFIGGCSV